MPTRANLIIAASIGLSIASLLFALTMWLGTTGAAPFIYTIF